MRILASLLLVLAFLLPFLLFGGRSFSSVVLASAALQAAAAGLAGWSAGARFHRGVLILASIPLLVGALQLVALPHSLIEKLSPVRARLQAALPVEDMDSWGAAATRTLSLAELRGAGAQALEQRERDPGSYALSFDPAGTVLALIALAAALALLASLAGQADERLGLRALAACLVLLGAGALYGLWHARAGGPLYGIFEPPPFDQHRPYGTFWNLNHFAGLCALSCPVLLAASLDRTRELSIRFGAFLLLIPCALAVLDAGSRGALLAGGAGALLLALLLGRTPGSRGLGLALGAVSILALVLALSVFSESLIDESLEETTAAEQGSNRQRLELYRRELTMLRTAPLGGHGLGAFHDAHGPYKQSSESLVPHHGESDWLETAVEGGVLGSLAFLGLVLTLWWPVLRVAISGRAPVLLSGLWAGSIATVLHAAVDFQHREPAVALVSLLLAGTAHAWARRLLRVADGGVEPAPAAPTRIHRLIALACVLLAVFTMSLVRDALHFDLGRDGALRALESGDLEAALAAAVEARRARPSSGRGWALEAAAHEQLAWRARGQARSAHLESALVASAAALRCTPATLGAARRAGAILLTLGASSEARRAAELALLAAPGHSPSRQLMGEVLLEEGRFAEALADLAFAYEGVPLARLAEQAPQFARLLDEAAGGEPELLFAALRSPEHLAWYLSARAAAGRAAELPAYFRLLSGESLPERPRSFVGLLVQAPGPEAAAFGRHLLAGLEDGWSRSLAARALVEGGSVDEGAALLSVIVEREDAPPGAWIYLADARRRQGRDDEIRRLLEAGLARHPGDAGLTQRLAALSPG